MTSRFIKYALVPMIVLALIGFTLMAAGAQSETPPPTPNPEGDCASCHPEHYEAWHVGLHGDIQAGLMQQKEMNCIACHKDGPIVPTGNQEPSSQTFQNQWEQGGRPPLCLGCHATGFDPATGNVKAYGITCETCHGDLLPDHPSGKMPINRSQELCQNCHSETRFNWTSWKSSMHYQSSMKCSTCHDPHTGTLKIVDEKVTDVSEMCIACHDSQSGNGQHSIHAEAGVTCVGCHLGPSKGKDDFHRAPDHSFVPALSTCNSCHAEQMHDAGEAVKPTGEAVPAFLPTETTTPEPVATPIPLQTSSTPAPASATGFIVVFGVLGLVGGVIMRGNIKRR